MSILGLSKAKETMTGVEAESTVNSFKQDDRLWTIQGKTGNARVRFLPFYDGKQSYPYICIYQIGAKRIGADGKTKWLIEKSLKSLGQTCPLEEAYNFLKAESARGNKTADKLLADGFKLTKNFYSNVFVRSDVNNGEHTGKVMIFRYGIQLKNKLESFASPDEEQIKLGAVPRDPFDPLEGYDVILTKSLGNNGIPSWENSKVLESEKGPFSSKITTVDEYLAACQSGRIHDITELKDIKNFKSYEEIKKRIAAFYPGLEQGILADTAASNSFIKPVTPNVQQAVQTEGEIPFDTTPTANAADSWLD